MTFRVGQKVVCVSDAVSRFSGLPTNLRKGAIYTISSVHINAVTDTLGVHLLEIEPPEPHYDYDAVRFRPIVERKTDIGFAHEILRKAMKRAPALALSSKER